MAKSRANRILKNGIWRYLDPIEASFVAATSFSYQVDVIDDFIDGLHDVKIPPESVIYLCGIRHDAFQAYKEKNFELMSAHLKNLEMACKFSGIRRSAEVGQKRQNQLADFGVKGAEARRIYTDDDKKRWLEMVLLPEIARLKSKKRKAEIIARREGLPPAAIESIRKLI